MHTPIAHKLVHAHKGWERAPYDPDVEGINKHADIGHMEDLHHPDAQWHAYMLIFQYGWFCLVWYGHHPGR